MKLHYCQTVGGNFGDDMNLWFWDEVMPGWADFDPSITMFGIGTLLSAKSLRSYDKVLVCGSGTGYGNVRSLDPSHVEIGWVRGPKTADLLGLDQSAAISDPASLVAGMERFKGVQRGQGGTIFIPHRLTARLDLNWQRVSERLGADVVLPSDGDQTVISRIAGAELVIAESMHAAIIADAFRVPWIPVRISHHFNEFKWRDWADGLDADLDFQDALSQLRRAYFLLRRGKSALLRRGASKSTKKTPSQTFKTKVEDGSFTNPNFMQEEEREFVKKAISGLAPVVERLLVRDLKRVMQARPYLSIDGAQQARQAQMLERIEQLTRRFS